MYYVFWDSETVGRKINGFTQIISLSAILTNENFEEIDRIENEISRLNKFCIPEIGALLVNNFDPNDINWQQKQSSYEMVNSIAKKFNEWVNKYGEIIWIAYNNNFDSTLWRYNQYVNLVCDSIYAMDTLPCGQLDGLKFAHLLGSFSEDLKVPIADENDSAGRKSFRLEGLAKENSIDFEGAAHDALFDCLVLKDFVKKFESNNKELFQALINTSHKSKARGLLDSSKDFIMSTAWYMGRRFDYPLSYVGVTDNNKNEAILIDLREANPELLEKDHLQLKKAFNEKKKRSIRKLYLNKNPIILDSSYFLQKKDTFNISYEEAQKRHNMIQESKEFKNRLLSVAYDINSEKPFSNDYDYAETALYAGFFNQDENQLKAFHAEKDWNNKKKIIKSFKDPRLVELGMNLVFNNDPLAMSENERKRVFSKISSRITDSNIDKRGPFNTIPLARDELVTLQQEAEEEENVERLKKLEGLHDYLDKVEKNLEEDGRN